MCLRFTLPIVIVLMLLLHLLLNLVNRVIMTNSQHDFIKSFADSELLNIFFESDVCLFIACQVALESGFGSSGLCKLQSNFIGMKQPFKRFGTYIWPYYVSLRDPSDIVSLDFASYPDVDACLADYVCWVLYYHPRRSDLSCASDYARWLSGKYCPDDDYIDSITSLYNQYNNFKHE